MLGVALISEIVIIAISSIFLFAHAKDVSIAPILPWNGLTDGVAPGIGVFFAFWSWVGFEAAPNYAEEAKDPVKTIPIALIFSCVAVGILYTIMSWALVSAYGTNINWANVGNAGNTAVINGKTVPVGLAPTSCSAPCRRAAGEFWRDALSYLIITGSLACAAALTNAGLRYMYAMGREGLLPRYLGKTHPVHKSPYTAVLTWGAVAVVLFVIFRVTSHTGLDAYYWLSPQGVIWIVLVQALTALSVFAYFRREHPSEQSWKTTVCAWLGFLGQMFVLVLFYHYETFVAAGSVDLRRGAVHDRLRDVVGARLLARHHRRRRAGGLDAVRLHHPGAEPGRSTRSWAASSTSPTSESRSRAGCVSPRTQRVGLRPHARGLRHAAVPRAGGARMAGAGIAPGGLLPGRRDLGVEGQAALRHAVGRHETERPGLDGREVAVPGVAGEIEAAAPEAQRVRAAGAVDDARVGRPVVGGLLPPGRAAVEAAVGGRAGAAQRPVRRERDQQALPVVAGGSRAAQPAAGGWSGSPGSTSRAPRPGRCREWTTCTCSTGCARPARAQAAWRQRVQTGTSSSSPLSSRSSTSRGSARSISARSRGLRSARSSGVEREAREAWGSAPPSACAMRFARPGAQQRGEREQEQRDQPPQGRRLHARLAALHGHGR